MPKLIAAKDQLTARPSFRARGNSAWHSVSSGSGEVMEFDVADTNVGGHFNTSTYKFKAPCFGTYQFALSMYARLDSGQGDNSNYYWGYMQLNGGNIGNQYIWGYQNGPDYDVGATASTLTLELKAGDLVHCQFNANGVSCSYYPGLSTFSGHLVG